MLSPKALVPQCTQALASTLRPRRSPNTNPPSLVKGAVAVMARAFPQPLAARCQERLPSLRGRRGAPGPVR